MVFSMGTDSSISRHHSIPSVFFLFFESTLTFTLWAVAKKEDGSSLHLMPQSCSRGAQSIPWTGLCTRNPRREEIRAGFAFSPEEQERVAARTKPRESSSQTYVTLP